MTDYTRPLARLGVPGELPGAIPLAGSRHAFFADAQARTDRSPWSPVRAADLPETARIRLSAPRPAIAGLALDRPRIMGIVNVTPDSFSDGGDRFALSDAVAAAREMEADADIIDIGGESTRPGAEDVSITDEIARVVPAICAIRDAGVATPISIDTRKARVAEAALDAGADAVNDVAAMAYDPEIADLVAERGVPICLMHARGTPATMQDAPRYDDVLTDVFDWLAERVDLAERAGIPRPNIIADPGIGFGKTLAHNLTILRGLALYHDLGVPLLLGASRKQFIGTVGNAPTARDRMPGSVAVALHGVSQGAHILRVHDVTATRQAISLFLAANEGSWNDA